MIPLLRRSQGITLDELTRLLKTTRKEILACVKLLNFCGVPPYLPHDYITVLVEGDRISIDYADHFERPTALTLREALALKLALEALPPGDEELAQASLELQDALDLLLRKQGSGELTTELDGRLAAPKSDAVVRKLSQLREAVRRRRPIDIVYFSASSDATAPRRVQPLGLGEQSGNHYLVALDEGKQDLRHFRVDRIESIVEPKDAPTFQPPPGFDLHAFMKRGFAVQAGQPIRLRFDKAVARFVREDMDGYPMESLPSGDLVVEIQAGSVRWAVSRALAYGEHVQVLGPPEAQAELRRRLEGFLAAQERRAGR
jgi:proteasome accessory factor C